MFIPVAIHYLSEAFSTAGLRLSEEFHSAMFAEPTPVIRAKMESQGWRFEQSSVYKDSYGHDVSCLMIYNPEGEIAYVCDLEFSCLIEGVKKGGHKEYELARQQAIRTLPWWPGF